MERLWDNSHSLLIRASGKLSLNTFLEQRCKLNHASESCFWQLTDGSSKTQKSQKNYFKNIVHPDAYKAYTSMLKHRVIDVGSMYYEDFGYIPNTNELATHLGLEQTDHRAKSDAMFVVKAVRMKNKINLF